MAMAPATLPAIAPIHSEELWLHEPETQPLLAHDAAEDKREPDNAPLDLAPAPRGLSPIQLAPDDGSIADTTPPARRNWRMPDLFGAIREENRSVLDDIVRGFFILLTTPIAFAGMGLYACGMIIEGIAMIMKGVGSFGGKLLMRRRRGSQSPRPEAWV
ncbi:hypothetical protein BDZ97DRAFT_1789528 [Flammula alnicola]|nr:hypothetical protein BDZ97DRAFT_1789528 [Flammula alnicola]